ncbi:MAG: molybdopterin-dependent oxidoreductase [Verrucomicrobia bacterium]|nr:molybdopterin-dependent oxidoreductase [Verrucomicrobiota bacterium]
MSVTRRQTLKYLSSILGSALVSGKTNFLSPVGNVLNPMEYYPSRDWERSYRDQYSYDSSFNFLCVPNDTHNCRLTAFVRDGVAVRIEQAYDLDQTQDLYGNKASAAWGPRGCLKGYSLLQRVYGPHRHKFPTVRKGWLAWAEAGFPRDGDYRDKYFKGRGSDDRLRVSWDEAFTLIAKALLNITGTYSGEEGSRVLEQQGYPSSMIHQLNGVGTQTVKMRSAISACGPVAKQGSLVRFANMLALLDAHVRKVEPAQAKGGRHWTTYEYLGDMDPGFPQVTGVNAFDVDMSDMRHSKLVVVFGKNFVEHKMADVHWMVEGIERQSKIVVVGPDYNPTSQKADLWVPVRPGSDTALLLGVANQVIEKRYHDEGFIKKHSDLPLLVRMDTLKKLRAADIIPGYKNAENTGYSLEVQKIDPKLRAQWGDYVVWDAKSNGPAVLTREDVGDKMLAKGIDPVLDGEFEIQGADGAAIRCRTGFSLQREALAYYTVDRVSEITGTPPRLIEQLAHDVGAIKPCAIHSGEGVNHYYHADLKGRAVILLCTLTGNLGTFGAGPGTWAGNYKVNSMDGLPVYVAEDPFHPHEKTPKVRKLYTEEHPVFWVNGGPTWATGKTHMPTPTKVMWTANTNMINNCPWLYNVLAHELPKVELFINNDWEYNLSCEYSDIALPVPSWLETTLPDITGSGTNPFCSIWKGGLKPLFDTKMDSETVAGVAVKLSEMTGDERFREYFKYILEGNSEYYIQRLMDASSTLKGYNCEEILKSGRSVLMNFRTYPRITGYEQIQESVPFYNKTGRLEFYREEDTFIREGENLIIHREPIEATKYLPNVIICGTAEALRPEKREIAITETSADQRARRNLVLPWEQVKQIENPLVARGYQFVFITTKSRHSTHSSWMMADFNKMLISSFGDPYRGDKRSPGVGEPEVRVNPDDAKALHIQDGDYVFIDANSEDRPYIGWKPEDPLYQAARLLVRARYDPRVRPGMVISRHAPWAATPRTVAAQSSRADGRTLTASGYESNFRRGSLQSCVRIYCQPTMMTDDIVRKNSVGQGISQGQGNDAYGVNAPYKEALVKLTKAEDGGVGGYGPWAPTLTGFTPGNESQTMRDYINGKFITRKS